MFIQERRSNLDAAKLARTRGLMEEAIPDALVSDFEDLIDSLELPDPDDRHVLAAAVVAGAQVIVTFNLSDFPESALSRYHIEAVHPDDFVLNTIDLAPAGVTQIITEQARDLLKPPKTIPELLETLLDQGLVRSVARLQELF